MPTAVLERHLIAIEGLPGSGHSAFARWIGEHPDWYAVCEDVPLPGAAKGPRTSPLSPLLQRLLDRYERTQALVGPDLFRGRIVTDHTFDTHRLWARALLPEREWLLYQKIADVIVPPAVAPDLVVYLQAPVTELVAALRPLDKSIDVERWRELVAAYNHYFFAYENTPLLVVRIQSSSWTSTDGAREALWERIAAFPGGKTYLVGEVDFWEGGDPTGD